jgi:hypothetical protein
MALIEKYEKVGWDVILDANVKHNDSWRVSKWKFVGGGDLTKDYEISALYFSTEAAAYAAHQISYQGWDLDYISGWDRDDDKARRE